MYKIIGANQQEYGPITADQLRAWIAEGRVNGQTSAKAEGDTAWKPLSMFPEFASALPSTPPPLSPGTPPAPAGMSPTGVAPIPNYLVQAILCTLCCCLPFGIVAIVYAAQVNGKVQAGDHQGAMAASKNAKMWCWVAFGLGIVTNGVILAIQLAAGVASGFNH
jgi:Interferon-induced transmembrane protein/GYF domain 2